MKYADLFHGQNQVAQRAGKIKGVERFSTIWGLK